MRANGPHAFTTFNLTGISTSMKKLEDFGGMSVVGSSRAEQKSGKVSGAFRSFSAQVRYVS